ncbi:MAG: hypothetical protein OEY14_06690 [Myxococcales bacterium]|nr:hypothetical protein [Myxococcales bacterium]
MKCEHCGRPMVALLVSYVCEACDAARDAGSFARGWIVWRSRPAGSCEYVFRTRDDALMWRDACGYEEHPVRPVLARAPFRWRMSQGLIGGLQVADRLYQIYLAAPDGLAADHAFLEG